MNEALQNLEIKVENGGSTPQGRVSAAEWNVLVAGVKALDLAGFDEAALRDYLDQYDYITRPELNKALEGIGGSSGGGIAYPLTWSGYSQGMWDGSASANIAIPSLMSQLTNDIGYIKDVSSDMIEAALGYTPYNSTNPNGYITPSALSPYATTAGVNSLLTEYLPITGGTMSDRIDFDKTYGSILTIRDGRYGQSAVISIGYTESEGDTIKLHIPTAGSYDEYFLLTQHQGATLTTDLAIYGKLHTKDSYRQLYHDSYNGQVAHSILNFITNPYGLLTRIYGNGDVSLQAQRESTNNEYFNLLLNEYGGNVVIGGELHANDTISFVGSGNTAIQFPDGKYIDRYGNIVLPSTASQWSVKQGDALLAVKVSSEVYVKGWLNFDKPAGPILTIKYGQYAQSTALSIGWNASEGDNIKLHIPGAGTCDHHLLLTQYAGATLSMGLKVNGNLLATGEITQHSSLVLKDVVDTRFLTLKELVALKPYSFYWKDKRDDKLHAGAVADYVMPILPEVISTDKDNIHSMNYANAAWVVSTSLTPYVNNLVEEMKRLKVRVKYLENKLKES